MTLLCKSRKCRRRRAIGAALTLRKSSLSSSSSSSSSTRSASDFENAEERSYAARTRGVIIWLVNLYCARRASFLRGLLHRCHVRPCQPLLRATLISFFFYFSRSLSCRSSSPPPPLPLLLLLSALFLLWHRFTYRDKDLPDTLVRDAGLEFLVPFPCSLCQRPTFCARFSVENRVKR